MSNSEDKMELTTDEKRFLINLLGQLNVKPSQEDAAKIVELVHSITKKLNA